MRVDLLLYLIWLAWTLGMFLEPQGASSVVGWMLYSIFALIYLLCAGINKLLRP